MSRQKPEVIELLDSSSSLMSPPPEPKSKNVFEIEDNSSDEGANGQVVDFGNFREAREKLLKIVGKSNISNIPRYNDYRPSSSSLPPKKESRETFKDDQEIHTGLSQEYQSLTFSNIVEKKRVKVKGDALPEICIQIPRSVNDILKKEEKDELLVLPDIDWIGDSYVVEDVKFIFWKRRHEARIPYEYVVALIDLEKVFRLIETREFDRLFTNIFQYCQLRHKFLFLLGVRKFVQKLQSQENRHFKQLLASNKAITPERMNKPNWVDLEQELYIAALNESIQITTIPDGQLASHLVEMTKCIAWEPHAQLQKEELGSAMGATDVHTGQNLTDTWRQMLCVIPSVSDITAGLIVNRYPTLQDLRRDFLTNGPNVLGNLELSNRRLGNALSNRIYMVIIGTDSTTLIRQ